MVEITIKTVKLSAIKRCTRCGDLKLITEFSPLKKGRGGRHSWCRKCKNLYCKEKHIENPEKKRLKDRLYRERNLETVREKDRERTRDPQKRRRDYLKWLSEHPKRSKEIKRNWEKRNPDKVMDASRRKRARRKNAIIEKFTAVEIFNRDNWICQLCHRPVNKKLRWPDPKSPTLDHIIPISKGGTHERKNTQLAHAVCNMKASSGGVKQMRLL